MNSDRNTASDNKANINKANRIRGRPKSSYSARALVFEDSDSELQSIKQHEATEPPAATTIVPKSIGAINKVSFNAQRSIDKTIESTTSNAGKIATKSDNLLEKEVAEGVLGACAAPQKSLKTYRVGEHNAMHHRKSYHTQHSHSLRSNEISNMVKVRHSTLGKSAPSLSANIVSRFRREFLSEKNSISFYHLERARTVKKIGAVSVTKRSCSNTQA